MEGLVDLAEEIFHAPVRLGVPRTVTGLADVVRNPIHATGVGLLLFGHQHENERSQSGGPHPGMSGAWGRMKSWFQGNF